MTTIALLVLHTGKLKINSILKPNSHPSRRSRWPSGYSKHSKQNIKTNRTADNDNKPKQKHNLGTDSNNLHGVMRGERGGGGGLTHITGKRTYKVILVVSSSLSFIIFSKEHQSVRQCPQCTNPFMFSLYHLIISDDASCPPDMRQSHFADSGSSKVCLISVGTW